MNLDGCDLNIAVTNYINCEVFNSEEFEFLSYIIKQIENKKHCGLLVGGVVRDFLLKHTVSLDIDIATTMPAQEVFETFTTNKLSMACFWAGQTNYNTISLVHKPYKIDITTLREDFECNGRFAKTKTTNSYFSDSCRRDFTINALYLNINTATIYDFHNGLTDLKNKRVRFVGNINTRIEEDYLRILRYFRFCSKLNSDCDEEVCKIIASYAHKINSLSKERITSEFIEIIYTENPKLVEMARCGITNAIGFDKNISVEITKTIINNYHQNTNNIFPKEQTITAFLIENVDCLDKINSNKILTIPTKILKPLIRLRSFLQEYTNIDIVDLLTKNNKKVCEIWLLILLQNNLREFSWCVLLPMSQFYKSKVVLEHYYEILKKENVFKNIEFNKNTKSIIVYKQIKQIKTLQIK